MALPMIHTCLLLLATAGGAPDKAAEAEALAKMTSDIGAKARMGKLTPEDLLYPCSDVTLCAGACREHLEAIGSGRKTEKTCPALAALPAGPDRKARAAALVRTWIGRAARQHRKALSEAGRERLDCGLGRLGLGPARPKACLAEDDRLALKSLPEVAAMDPAGTRTVLAAFCAELEDCAGGCGEELAFLSKVDLSALDKEGPPAPPGCPAFKVVSAGPAKGADRAWLFIREQNRRYLESLCKRATPAQRPEIACAGKRLGVLDGTEACGPPAASCPAPAPPAR